MASTESYPKRWEVFFTLFNAIIRQRELNIFGTHPEFKTRDGDYPDK
jgi:hypothetical protein